ncbi:MAG: hypothetical protein U0T69_07800 [Chitinophagales bacterium]
MVIVLWPVSRLQKYSIIKQVKVPPEDCELSKEDVEHFKTHSGYRYSYTKSEGYNDAYVIRVKIDNQYHYSSQIEIKKEDLQFLINCNRGVYVNFYSNGLSVVTLNK